MFLYQSLQNLANRKIQILVENHKIQVEKLTRNIKSQILVEKSLHTTFLLEPDVVHNLLSLCSGQLLPVTFGQP